VEYSRGAEPAHEGCCCGNEFAVGPRATRALADRPGFQREQITFSAPWGDPIEAAWSVGPSVHGVTDEHEVNADDAGGDTTSPVIDPVCGMTVEPAAARAGGLHVTFNDVDYFFCGKGCRLDFDEDPERYLAAGYIPSM
jgi:YHS domain-containing protein